MKELIAVFICLFTLPVFAQIEIGKATDKANILTADSMLLVKAIARTLNDGTLVKRMYIESKNANHYLVAEGENRSFRKLAAFVLTYNISTRTYFAEKDLGYFTCTSAACDNCSLFKEDGKINGCKCAAKATVSNECNFTRVDQSAFYMNMVRARMMMNNRKPQP